MIKCNFHIHTSYSDDGFISPKSLYKFARSNGLNSLCITDHDTIGGALFFRDWLYRNKKDDLELVIGEEITTDENIHVIGLFLNKGIKSKCMTEVVQEIKDQGGFVYLPHPTRDDGIMKSEYRDYVLKNSDFVEVFNAKILDSYNDEAKKIICNKPKEHFIFLRSKGIKNAIINQGMLCGYTYVRCCFTPSGWTRVSDEYCKAMSSFTILYRTVILSVTKK